jgi:GGDEF domain-containing protein
VRRPGRAGFGLLLLDVDDFKRFNTEHGHPGGDRALVCVAESLRRAVRAGDLPARLGGDEFAVLVAGATPAGMEALAERVMETVRADGPGPGERRLGGGRVRRGRAAAGRRPRARRRQARRQGPRARPLHSSP